MFEPIKIECFEDVIKVILREYGFVDNESNCKALINQLDHYMFNFVEQDGNKFIGDDDED